MGLFFPIQFVNQVAYFTTAKKALTCPRRDLAGFFEMLGYQEWRLITGRDSGEWQQKVSSLAGRAAEVVARSSLGDSSWDDLVSLDQVFIRNQDILRELKKQLSDFELFALGVADRQRSAEVGELLSRVASEERFHNVLFLIPDRQEGPRDLDFYDPFPGATEICRYPERWPGILIWQRRGASMFLPLKTGLEYLPQIIAQAPQPLDVIKQSIPDTVTRKGVRLLHLSDLHCGRRETRKKQLYLLAEINKAAFREKYDKIIITGDLFDSPWIWKWQEFDNFLQTLRLMTKQDPILVPGNHDQRIKGLALWKIGSLFMAAGEIEWSTLNLEPKLKCVFYCFNSSKEGNFARGEVSGDDLTKAATDFLVQAELNPDIEEWLRIAVVHHHPFKFDAAAEGWTAKMLKRFKIPEGKLVDMNESERFVKWCGDRGVELILFGHRHVQRKFTQPLSMHGRNVDITAIGCGTSLGAEHVPLSFNIVSWDPADRRWSAEFFLDENGGGFNPVRALSVEAAPLSPPGAMH